MEQTTQSTDTVTFKRTHFYMALVVLSFCVGVLVGYIAWGRDSAAAVAQQPAAQQQAVTPTYRRYDIPTEGFYSIGPADAPITIVEFSDYQCPYCERWHTQVYNQLMAAYPGKIRFVYRNLPLTQIHPQAMPAAEASLCAGEQKAYWQFQQQLESNDVTWDEALQTERDAHVQWWKNWLSTNGIATKPKPETGREESAK